MASWIEMTTTPTSERHGLQQALDAARVGLIRKVEDVDDELARRTPTVSSLSLLGLLKHAVTWEHRWLEVIVAGRPSPEQWPEVEPEPHDRELLVDAGDTVMGWLDAYREQHATSNEIIAGTSLDALCARTDIVECNLRYVVIHLIQETARHAGHADIIRETLDGSRGV